MSYPTSKSNLRLSAQQKGVFFSIKKNTEKTQSLFLIFLLFCCEKEQKNGIPLCFQPPYYIRLIYFYLCERSSVTRILVNKFKCFARSRSYIKYPQLLRYFCEYFQKNFVEARVNEIF